MTDQTLVTDAAGTRESSGVVDDLVAALGDRVSTEAADLERMRGDKSGWLSPGRCEAVVFARSIEDVQSAVRIAARHGVPIVPRGAGTGLAGAATAGPGTVAISVERMDRILEIDYDDEIAVVEPGVINQALSDAVAERGYVFSPDPASKAISSIGGNIATDAGGLLCAKYGVTREAVLGLAVVLADGTLLRTGRRTVKGVTGYDLTALFTGSEGTLGIIVEATVRLRPIAQGLVATIGAFFPSTTAAAAACSAITASGIRPAVMELMDPLSVAAIDAYRGTALGEGGQAFVLVQTDGAGSAEEAEIASRLLVEGGAGRVDVTTDPVEGERLLAIRRSMHPAMETLGHVLIEDVCVPRSRLAEMFDEIARIGAETGLTIPVVAHAGDGNLHPNFVIPVEPGSDPGSVVVPDHVWAAADLLFQAGMRLGGTLTGEHGVGVLKRRWLADELGERSVELQRGIKAVFDPDGLMNPGKVY
ncbi:FAD-linked oxidase [Cnuibacter physcomitrellae]|uniref:FAD-binding oxidoreductase n=1 Tax=Cnuibacter physcomitrellae TaxID=1619308 RepID=A0A1X9LK27_9MICO|nr:FAD-linked oxidase C-terminal domain-containing protein [Cnuibacter physcomitrellae]ARJ05556.1 FAD-binding oxidoreductase [Cnuibacter physcomitrellae]GGI35954.1 FAD-linked oxidase [Cnuibacter physcomitrellae]